ncbi:hypothetical protein V6615_01750 [Oscillospiraceae bacterium PP1C4]
MFKDVPSFLDWLTFGMVSGALDVNAERYREMVQDPTVYSAANWLLSGTPESINNAFNSEKPFSFDHWMSSLETALLLYGGYQTAKQVMSQGTPSARPNSKPADKPKPTAGLKTELEYTPTSGVKLKATQGKTTTILGSFKKDIGKVVDELGNVKSTDFGPRNGGFNTLNVPDEIYTGMKQQQFWDKYNRPWLDNAIARKDTIVLATKPKPTLLYLDDLATGTKQLTGFGREYEYLLAHGYRYDPFSNQMISK